MNTAGYIYIILFRTHTLFIMNNTIIQFILIFYIEF